MAVLTETALLDLKRAYSVFKFSVIFIIQRGDRELQ
jgi:hypothetical protein